MNLWWIVINVQWALKACFFYIGLVKHFSTQIIFFAYISQNLHVKNSHDYCVFVSFSFL